jgi:hypothetical protein
VDKKHKSNPNRKEKNEMITGIIIGAAILGFEAAAITTMHFISKR